MNVKVNWVSSEEEMYFETSLKPDEVGFTTFKPV